MKVNDEYSRIRIQDPDPGSGSGSLSQRHGSEDPDPDPPQNVMDPQHCQIHAVRIIKPASVRNATITIYFLNLFPKRYDMVLIQVIVFMQIRILMRNSSL